jgi:hypothetical protein
VIKQRQALPHSRADVAMLPDPEEAAPFQRLAASGLDACGDDIPMMAVLEASAAAATAAAIAHAQAWWAYELCLARVHERLALIDARDEDIAQEFGRRLITIGSNQVLSLPFASPEGLEEPLGEVEAAGMAAASEAVTLILERLTGKRLSVPIPDSASPSGEIDRRAGGYGHGLLSGGDGQWNTTVDRNIPSQSAAAAVGETGSDDMNLPNTVASALLLEQRVWEELEAIGALSEKLSSKPLVLPDALLCLLPSDLDHRGCTRLPAAAVEFRQRRVSSAVEAVSKYPVARRLQRLSYTLLSVVNEFSEVEARQAALEAGSVTARLKLGLAALRWHSKVLAAVAAVDDVKPEGESDASSDST